MRKLHLFTQVLYYRFARWSLLDFFSFVDLQFVHSLLYDSLDLVMNVGQVPTLGWALSEEKESQEFASLT